MREGGGERESGGRGRERERGRGEGKGEGRRWVSVNGSSTYNYAKKVEKNEKGGGGKWVCKSEERQRERREK